jgi:lipopolysaccharide/colanic/teichoic acid biosynthesis glycosyltransferase
VKRALDVTVAMVCLAVTLPLLAFIALVIRLASGAPVLYVSPRIGRDGRPFGMWKFRSMVPGADRLGPLVTAADDPRITRVGRVLRSTKLDELPSLWNVVLGDMSLVGPRPENPRSVSAYTDEQRRVLRVRPGVTSLATVAYRHEEGILAGVDDVERAYLGIMLRKLALDLEYVERQSFWLDCRILARTVVALFR